MLSIKPISSAPEMVSYYAQLGRFEQHDYYSEGGERPGQFYGAGAGALNLSGDVKSSVLKNLLEGYSAKGDTRLVQPRYGTVSRRAGFDLTFSPAKSLSIARASADKDDQLRIDAAERSALQKTLDIVQELCGATRRGKNGIVQEHAKVLFCVFTHDTARGLPGEAPDVLRHYHCIMPNIAIREDGTTGAIDARPLFTRRMKMALGALFRAELSKQLAELGLLSHRPLNDQGKPKSWFELDCVPPTLVRAMSKRRHEIEHWLRKRKLKGARAAEKAALQTRAAKSKISKEHLRRSWRNQSHSFGFTQDTLQQAIVSGLTCPKQAAYPKHVARHAVANLVKEKARFSEIEILERTAVEAQCLGIGIKEIRSAVSNVIENSNELVRLRDRHDAIPIRTFTTKEMLALEKRMLANAQRLAALRDHSVSRMVLDRTIAEAKTLRPEQAVGIEHICGGTDLACVNGYQRSGKTFMLKHARVAWRRAGYRVLGTSLSGKATHGLQLESGIESFYVHRLLQLIASEKLRLDQHTILVVDEAGMLGTRQFAELVRLTREAHGKLVAVGDWTQLQPIDGGAAFRMVAQDIGYRRLNDIIRQRHEEDKEIVRQLRGGEALEALTELQDRGRLTFAEDRSEAISEIVNDWTELVRRRALLKDVVVLAGSKADVRELNLRIQDRRRACGELGDMSIPLDGYEICVGDRVTATRNRPMLCLNNGSCGIVTAISDGLLTFRLDEGISVDINTKQYDHLTLAYASTTHRAQGISCEYALVLSGDSMTDREISYVQSGRAKEETRFYCDELSAENVPELAELMARSRQKENALEHIMEQEHCSE